jgi:transposase
MPYKTDKIKIDCPFFDKRTKLLPCQRERMVYLYKLGYSQRKLASIFNVSRRLVQFVTCPEKKAKDLQNRRDRGGSMVYYKGGEHWAETMRRHRRSKYELLSKTI